MEPKDFIEEIVKKWMYHDIEMATKGKANFLTALGLLSYTEFMGGLVTGELRNEGCSRKNFEEFICGYFPEEYKNYATSLYKEVRCGLTHEYFVKRGNKNNPAIKYFTENMGIVINNPEDPNCDKDYGLTCAIKMVDEKIEFHVNQYFKDFKNAVENYLKRVAEEKNLRDNFFAVYPEDKTSSSVLTTTSCTINKASVTSEDTTQS